MSLRYAHLAPDQRREAVAKLNQRPLLTMTMHLEREGSPAVSGCRVVLFRSFPQMGVANYSVGSRVADR
jgi:hypothetical protein